MEKKVTPRLPKKTLIAQTTLFSVTFKEKETATDWSV